MGSQLFYLQFALKKVSGLSVSTSKVRTLLHTYSTTHGTVPSSARTILWSVNDSCKEVSVSEVKQG